MCTLARLVQGATATVWFGMPMEANPRASNTRVKLKPGEQAFVEVTIDPAAHGEAGIGPILRGVMLETESGQKLQFELAAQVTR